MNKFDLLVKRNNTARLLDLSYKGKRNAVYVNGNEGKLHALKKADICHELRKRDMEFYTECIFKNKKRADILVLDSAKIIEVLSSEKIEDAVLKKEFYPFPILFVYAEDEFKEEWLD